MPTTDDALTEARRTIEWQEQEIERLRSRGAENRISEDLRHALSLASLTATIAAPSEHGRLLQSIVETAARVIPSDAASLFLIDSTTEELIFEIALGQKAEEVKSFRVPLGHGIAGLVAVSGQPMTVSDVEHDPRHASDVSQQIGYTPHSILCCPLVYNDEVIGVLELLDRKGAPAYSPEDIETLWYFANQAAIALELSRTSRSLSRLITAAMQATSSRLDESGMSGALRFVENLEEDRVYRRALELADLVREIAWRGEDELLLCEGVLRDFIRYLTSRVDPGSTGEHA